MEFTKKWRRAIVVTAGALFLFVALIIAAYLPGALRSVNWKQTTSPLPLEDIAYLCEALNIRDNEKVCFSNTDIYGPDFFPIIEEKYLSVDGDPISFEEFDKVFGNYLIECGNWVQQADGKEYFVCEYDLRGDDAFTFIALFDSDWNLWKLFSDLEKP